jgi:hypothetical protein
MQIFIGDGDLAIEFAFRILSFKLLCRFSLLKFVVCNNAGCNFHNEAKAGTLLSII